MPPVSRSDPASSPLSGEDLSFWYSDQPRQRTTMALLMLLDRQPDPDRLLAAAVRAVEAVPRLRQRVVDAPFDIALPRWEDDPTFDLEFHVRRYAQPAPRAGHDPLAELFHSLGPIYEREFDRTRPLWEMIEIDRSDGGSALFFRLHHAVADGVGGNTILAAMTDADRAGTPLPPLPSKPPGAWDEPRPLEQLATAVRRRVQEDADRARRVASALWSGLTSPAALGRAGQFVSQMVEDASFRSRSPLTRFGRSRHLTGMDVPFEPLREAKRALGGTMVDLLCTGVAGAVGRWHREHGRPEVDEVPTLVPINLRPRDEQGAAAGLGNRATGIVVRLPVATTDPIERFHQVHERVEARKVHPATDLLPELGEWLSGVPRVLYRAFALQVSSGIELIVTNVPGIPVRRYVAGAEIAAAYPFAPTAPHAPVSVALYGYCGRLYVGLDADGTAMQDLDVFCGMLREAFDELIEAAGASAG